MLAAASNVLKFHQPAIIQDNPASYKVDTDTIYKRTAIAAFAALALVTSVVINSGAGLSGLTHIEIETFAFGAILPVWIAVEQKFTIITKVFAVYMSVMLIAFATPTTTGIYALSCLSAYAVALLNSYLKQSAEDEVARHAIDQFLKTDGKDSAASEHIKHNSKTQFQLLEREISDQQLKSFLEAGIFSVDTLAAEIHDFRYEVLSKLLERGAFKYKQARDLFTEMLIRDASVESILIDKNRKKKREGNRGYELEKMDILNTRELIGKIFPSDFTTDEQMSLWKNCKVVSVFGKELKHVGFDPNIRNNDEETPLENTIRLGYSKVDLTDKDKDAVEYLQQVQVQAKDPLKTICQLLKLGAKRPLLDAEIVIDNAPTTLRELQEKHPELKQAFKQSFMLEAPKMEQKNPFFSWNPVIQIDNKEQMAYPNSSRLFYRIFNVSMSIFVTLSLSLLAIEKNFSVMLPMSGLILFTATALASIAYYYFENKRTTHELNLRAVESFKQPFHSSALTTMVVEDHDMIRHLKGAGIDLNKLDENGKTFLDEARRLCEVHDKDETKLKHYQESCDLLLA